MKFSQRIGNREVKTELNRAKMSAELRNSLWTLILEYIINHRSDDDGYGGEPSSLLKYFRALWIYFFKWPIDTLSWGANYGDARSTKLKVREWFFEADWDLALDFIEFSSEFHRGFENACNDFFKTEFSAYRFVEGKLVEVNSEEEIIEIEKAIKNSDKFNSVKTHLNTALGLLADRKKPDYRNSIKESISAVESLAKIITNDDKATLGKALNKIETKHNIPKNLKSAFSALYGYTSEESGIRHGLLEEGTSVDIEEARFMLIACSAFVNYLISKM